MVSNLQSELVDDLHLADLRRASLLVAERRVLHKCELEACTPGAAAPVWRVALHLLGARLVAVGERVQALGPVTVKPGT